MLALAYLDHAFAIVQEYRLQQPLAFFLKAYFKAHRQCGSRDRRKIADLVYGYYRMGPQPASEESSSPLHPIKKRIVLGAWLQGDFPAAFFDATWPALSAGVGAAQEQRFRKAREEHGWQAPQGFPMSNAAQQTSFPERLYRKPSVFIRVRRRWSSIEKKLKAAGTRYEIISDQCLRVAPNTKLDEVLSPEEFVVQDLGSQRVGEFLHPLAGESWWDCCAGSGGKSLLLLDQEEKIRLTVSDVRPGILQNLQGRITLYHPHVQYRSVCTDLSQTGESIPGAPFDHILCDVPCSGSGTWARSPEQAWFFTPEDLDSFHQKQCRISMHAAQSLKPGGRLVYITCSVFARENEEVLQHLNGHGLQTEEQHLLDAHAEGGDALFLAILRKPQA